MRNITNRIGLMECATTPTTPVDLIKPCECTSIIDKHAYVQPSAVFICSEMEQATNHIVNSKWITFSLSKCVRLLFHLIGYVISHLPSQPIYSTSLSKHDSYKPFLVYNSYLSSDHKNKSSRWRLPSLIMLIWTKEHDALSVVIVTGIGLAKMQWTHP